MRIELAGQPGDSGRPNEDFAAVALPASGAGGALVVLDGVTPPARGTGCVHGVPWFTTRLGTTLLELAAGERRMELGACLSEAVARTAQAHRDTCDLSARLTPQATVVAVRWDAEVVEHLVLSDSVLLLEGADGEVRAVLDDRLDRLVALGPVTDDQRNVEGGFFTAAADPGVAARAVTGTTAREAVRALAALTDGASRWVEVFREGAWAECFALLAKEGPRALVERVRQAEAADAQCRAFRRGKPHDDATAVYVQL
ncbi:MULTISPECIES: hypothetical protein [Streptomyces]|uniref:Protein phosphatase 2C domain-containing protein n=1 Tax=Streptomyces luteosporeus TaxID=173856 RepID=A0ABN3TZV7_9ACTN